MILQINKFTYVDFDKIEALRMNGVSQPILTVSGKDYVATMYTFEEILRYFQNRDASKIEAAY
jgi:hypothetical protein